MDIRDLWPDVYLTMIPKVLHPIGRRLLYAEFRRAKYIFKNATGITAVSKTYLEKGLFYAQRRQNPIDSFFPLGSYKLANSDVIHPADTGNSIFKRYDILSKKQFIITYVGTFSKFLDVQNILDAARLLKDNSEIKIYIIGTGDRSKEFFKKAGQLPNVTMTGWLNATDVRQILQNTSVGLVAYAKNAIMSLPNKPFEYMAEGLPLLSSLSGELNQLIDENGIGRTYEAGNPVSQPRICWLYNHPKETLEMGKRSRFLFMKKFNSEVVYKELAEHLRAFLLVGCIRPNLVIRNMHFFRGRRQFQFRNDWD